MKSIFIEVTPADQIGLWILASCWVVFTFWIAFKD